MPVPVGNSLVSQGYGAAECGKAVPCLLDGEGAPLAQDSSGPSPGWADPGLRHPFPGLVLPPCLIQGQAGCKQAGIEVPRSLQMNKGKKKKIELLLEHWHWRAGIGSARTAGPSAAQLVHWARSQTLPSQDHVLKLPKTPGNKFSSKEISGVTAPDYLLVQEAVLKYFKCMGHTFWEI